MVEVVVLLLAGAFDAVRSVTAEWQHAPAQRTAIPGRAACTLVPAVPLELRDDWAAEARR
ncbi:hypothetical protein ACFVVA_41205 [Kitasatospora sp. NPDC058048]|uniref:hypothetical protein n=1 Tax=Kitasatospora sp. NPDC058048 TaxID=3346313 RepID=UPI0036D934F6